MRQPLSISVFFPAYNDALSIPSLIARTAGLLTEIGADFEIIVVNDGSQDNTGAVLEHLGRECSYLRVVSHTHNRGYGAALRSGFAAATKDFVFYTDGDGQYDPSELRLLLEAATADTDWVNGYKIERHDPAHRVFIGNSYNWLVRRAFGLQLRDTDCDFRLIRRSKLDLDQISSSSGTICVELAHSLQKAGARLVEVPVHHYAREHGSSQFFRLGPLLTTALDLVGIYWKRVAWPFFSASPGWSVATMLVALTVLSLLTYARSLTLPFIADDYIQIQLGRDYGPFDKWEKLAQDALYRCRATSIVLTYWIDQAFGATPLPHNLLQFALHIANSLLVFAAGFWRPIGWRVSAIAACFFAISQRHSEAVIWYAALPEVLVFFFAMASVLAWIWWFQQERYSTLAYVASLTLYAVALLSKESAVVVGPLCLLALLVDRSRRWTAALSLVPFAALGIAYFQSILQASAGHLHFQDGTFSLSAPFLLVALRSSLNLLWVWGLVALLFLALVRALPLRTVLVATGWIGIAILPYSFLTYMSRVPSRHTYLPSVGLAVLVAAGLLVFAKWTSQRNLRWLTPIAASVILVHQVSYVSIFKYKQYKLRAEPTEQLLAAAREGSGPVYLKCFPYSIYVAQYAFKVTAVARDVVIGAAAKDRPDALDLCNAAAYE